MLRIYSWNLETFQSSQSVSNKLRGMYVHHGKNCKALAFPGAFFKIAIASATKIIRLMPFSRHYLCITFFFKKKKKKLGIQDTMLYLACFLRFRG